MKTFFFVLAMAGLTSAPVRAISYHADPDYSAVTVSIRHFRFFHPTVDFETIDADFDYEEGKPEVWKASATISAASVNAGNSKKNQKLLSRRFLNAAAYPDIRFVSTRTTAAKDGRVTMDGDLTIRGVTKPVRLNVEEDKPLEPRLDGRMGLSAEGVIDRRLWGIAGGLFFGDQIQIRVLLQGVPTFPAAKD